MMPLRAPFDLRHVLLALEREDVPLTVDERRAAHAWLVGLAATHRGRESDRKLLRDTYLRLAARALPLPATASTWRRARALAEAVQAFDSIHARAYLSGHKAPQSDLHRALLAARQLQIEQRPLPSSPKQIAAVLNGEPVEENAPVFLPAAGGIVTLQPSTSETAA